MNDEEKIEELLNSASEYAAVALGNLIEIPEEWNELDELEREIKEDTLKLRLEISYLFPNLLLHERDDLTELASIVSALTVVLNLKHPIGDRHEEMIITRMESRFMDLKAKMETSEIMGKLSPVQRRILESEYFSIPFVCCS
jgi:hypothetical protein